MVAGHGRELLRAVRRSEEDDGDGRREELLVKDLHFSVEVCRRVDVVEEADGVGSEVNGGLGVVKVVSDGVGVAKEGPIQP